MAAELCSMNGQPSVTTAPFYHLQLLQATDMQQHTVTVLSMNSDGPHCNLHGNTGFRTLVANVHLMTLVRHTRVGLANAPIKTQR